MQTERMFAELKSLAEERSSEKRLDLLRKIADLFFARIDEHSEAEASLFNEVIEQVVDQISRDGKIVVATDLATLRAFRRSWCASSPMIPTSRSPVRCCAVRSA
jgi:hypothetical protein